MIKLFASDLDGTLLNREHDIDNMIRQTIRKVEQAGGIVAIATGRSPLMCDMLKDENLYMCSNNGALILDDHGTILDKTLIDKTVLKTILEQFKDEPLQYVETDAIYHTVPYFAIRPSKGSDPKRKMPDWDHFRKFDCSIEDILSRDIVKINIHKESDAPYPKVEQLLATYPDRLINAATTPSIYEITDASVNKATGVKKLGQILRISEKETAVYGDAGNDLAMLQEFEHSYCPSTGLECAKEAASHIIGPYDDYAVVKHMLETIRNQK